MRYFTMTAAGDVLAEYATLSTARRNRDKWNSTHGKAEPCEVFENSPDGTTWRAAADEEESGQEPGWIDVPLW